MAQLLAPKTPSSLSSPRVQRWGTSLPLCSCAPPLFSVSLPLNLHLQRNDFGIDWGRCSCLYRSTQSKQTLQMARKPLHMMHILPRCDAAVLTWMQSLPLGNQMKVGPVVATWGHLLHVFAEKLHKLVLQFIAFIDNNSYRTQVRF